MSKILIERDVPRPRPDEGLEFVSYLKCFEDGERKNWSLMTVDVVATVPFGSLEQTSLAEIKKRVRQCFIAMGFGREPVIFSVALQIANAAWQITVYAIVRTGRRTKRRKLELESLAKAAFGPKAGLEIASLPSTRRLTDTFVRASRLSDVWSEDVEDAAQRELCEADMQMMYQKWRPADFFHSAEVGGLQFYTNTVRPVGHA